MRHYLGISLGNLNLLNIELRIVELETCIELPGNPSDRFTALTNDHARFLCIYGDVRSHRSAIDLHTAIACTLQFPVEVLIHLRSLQALLYEFFFSPHLLTTPALSRRLPYPYSLR